MFWGKRMVHIRGLRPEQSFIRTYRVKGYSILRVPTSPSPAYHSIDSESYELVLSRWFCIGI